MWIIGLIVIAVIFIGLFIILRENEDDDIIKCPECGCKFKYDKAKLIYYKYEGKYKNAKECPKCGEWVEVK